MTSFHLAAQAFFSILSGEFFAWHFRDVIGPMHTTSVSLIERLRHPSNHEAWSRFVRLYSPLLHYWAERTGFGTSEADDLVQEVFAHLVNEMPKFEYDQNKTFRGWLRTVAVNKWNEIRRRRQIDAMGMSHFDAADDGSQDPAKLFETDEFMRLLLQRAMEVMHTDFHGNTWLACKKVIMDGQPAVEVATDLGMTVGAVHAAYIRSGEQEIGQRGWRDREIQCLPSHLRSTTIMLRALKNLFMGDRPAKPARRVKKSRLNRTSIDAGAYYLK